MIYDRFASVVINKNAEYQNHVQEFIKQNYRLDSIDFIIDSEPIMVLAENNDKHSVNLLKRRVFDSIERYNSKLVAIIAHEPSNKTVEDMDTLHANLRSSVNTVRLWNVNAKVIGLWIDLNNAVSNVL